VAVVGQSPISRVIVQVKSGPIPLSGNARLIGNYLTTDQVLSVGGIQFQSEPLRKRKHLVELRMLPHATVTMSR
jgi:hypothetical protein